MKMIRAIIRPDKADDVLTALAESGFPAVTKVDVYGRGKQKGIRVGSVFYDELPKCMLLIVIEDSQEEEAVHIITANARTGEGNYGDGRIFVTPVTSAYTISGHSEGL